jgi:hypothetical protein
MDVPSRGATTREVTRSNVMTAVLRARVHWGTRNRSGWGSPAILDPYACGDRTAGTCDSHVTVFFDHVLSRRRMMNGMRKSHLVVVVAIGIASVVACGDDGSPSPSDGGGSGSACTNALYDPCTDASQCMSGNCRMFNMPSPGIQVCTQACSAGTPCPMQNGQAVECGSNSNVCRPTAANNCTR